MPHLRALSAAFVALFAAVTPFATLTTLTTFVVRAARAARGVSGAVAAVVAALAGGLLAPYPAAAAAAQPSAPMPLPRPSAGDTGTGTGAADTASRPDRLTITVEDTGDRTLDGTYRLRCRPAGGDHPDPRAACDALERATAHGDPFRPVRADSKCTRIYGGPATARITGTWHGRPVDARFRRTDGCEIDRWNKLEPVLPKTVSAG